MQCTKNVESIFNGYLVKEIKWKHLPTVFFFAVVVGKCPKYRTGLLLLSFTKKISPVNRII